MIPINPDETLIRKMEKLSKNELKEIIEQSDILVKKAEWYRQIKIVKENKIRLIEEYNLYYKLYKIN